jgi:hypothetical protein
MKKIKVKYMQIFGVFSEVMPGGFCKSYRLGVFIVLFVASGGWR